MKQQQLKLSVLEWIFYIGAAAAWCVCFSTLIEPEVHQLVEFLSKHI